MTRAFHAQPVAINTNATVNTPAGRYAAITIASGSPGITRSTLTISDSASSTKPPKYPAVTPTRAPTTTTAAPTNSPR